MLYLKNYIILKNITTLFCTPKGFQACIFGSAAVDLQHLYSVSTTRYSFAITLHSIMYMLGGGLLGVFYDRINPQLQVYY